MSFMREINQRVNNVVGKYKSNPKTKNAGVNLDLNAQLKKAAKITRGYYDNRFEDKNKEQLFWENTELKNKLDECNLSLNKCGENKNGGRRRKSRRRRPKRKPRRRKSKRRRPKRKSRRRKSRKRGRKSTRRR